MGSEKPLGGRGTQVELSETFNMGDQLCGIYCDPWEFVCAALEAKHPVDFACNIPDVLTRNVAKVLQTGPNW